LDLRLSEGRDLAPFRATYTWLENPYDGPWPGDPFSLQKLRQWTRFHVPPTYRKADIALRGTTIIMGTAPALPPFIPTDAARTTYSQQVAQAWTDQQASSDSFDNNLLTFSSAALGLSLAFIKDIVPLEHAEWLKTLYLSWGAFAGCIVVTIASFRVSVQAQRAHEGFLAEYYLRGREEYFNKRSRWSDALPWCALVGSTLFVAGIILTLAFASQNVSHLKEMGKWQTTTSQKK